MKEYYCNKCKKKFSQKSNWIQHTQERKKPCIKNQFKLGVREEWEEKNKNEIKKNNKSDNESENKTEIKIYNKSDNESENKTEIKKNNKNDNKSNKIYSVIKKFCCQYCLKLFTRSDNLKRHINNIKCEILRLQEKQKENIFINLLEEEKIVNQTKLDINHNIKHDNQTNFLVNQIKLLNNKLELQKKESEIKIEKQKTDIENRLKLMTDRYNELEEKHNDVIKINEKLQTKMNNIVNKNKITNNINSNNNITNTIINNPIIKLVNFGSEDLSKISHNIFIDTIKSQGIGLYNRAIDGIHFNKDHPENHNIYISDINRGKVMIYKNKKWIIDNWDNIFPDLLEKVVQFGYDKEQFLVDCDYRLDGKKYNKQMIKNGIRWYKLLSEDEPDVDYFTLDPKDRPQIDNDTYNDYVEMQEFRKKHPKKNTELNIKNKVKLNMYNKREIPINNYKNIEFDKIN